MDKIQVVQDTLKMRNFEKLSIKNLRDEPFVDNKTTWNYFKKLNKYKLSRSAAKKRRKTAHIRRSEPLNGGTFEK